MDLNSSALLFITLTALLVGFAKTSIGGLGILAVPLMAMAFPGKASVGVLLPMLIMADVFAVLFYRRHCNWKVFLRIFPITAVGVVMGYFLLGKVPDGHFHTILGAVILSMLFCEIYLSGKSLQPANSLWYTALIGLLAGITTMLANAAGPLFGIYLLQVGLPKEKFVGTRSWYFLLLNCFKMPFAGNLNLISWESLKLNALFLPLIICGALGGYLFLKKINMDILKWLIRIAALGSGVKFLFF